MDDKLSTKKNLKPLESRLEGKEIELDVEVEIDPDEQIQRQTEHTKQSEFRFKDEITETDISSLLLAFIKRKRFYYRLMDILRYLLCCFCFRDVQKNKSKKLFKNHYLYHKGEDKLKMELDVISLIKSLRKQKMFN